MKRIALLALVMFSIVLTCGCYSVAGRVVDDTNDDLDYVIYPGVQFWANYYFNDNPDVMDATGGDYSKHAKSTLALMTILDVPASAAFDTVCLPFDALVFLIELGVSGKD